MDAPAVVVCAVLGVLAGWFGVVPVVDQFREPSRAHDDEADEVGGDEFGDVDAVGDVDVVGEVGRLPVRARVVIAAVNGALWGFDANQFRRWWIVVTYFVVFSALLAVSVVDLRLFRIPDRIVFPALAVTVVLMPVATYAVTDSFDPLKYAAAGLVTYFLILFVFHVVYPAGMGFGDVKLALLMGLSLGWLGTSVGNAAYLVMIALFFGCLVGVGFGLAVRLVNRRGGAFPFGPALAVATVYVVLNFQRYVV